MEEKINIAAILKDKPNGIRLYSPIFGECTFCCVREDTNDICVKKHNGMKCFFDSKGLYYNTGEVMLFPSKEMRDWRKFNWKKCDVLVSNDGKIEVIFEKFNSDTYQSFTGKHQLDSLDENLYYQDGGVYPTAIFNIETEDAAQTYIKTIEEKLDGKLNLESLEIEKAQPEFKDGDVVVTDAVPSIWYSKCIFILKGDLNTGESRANSYVFFNINNNHISYDVLDTIERDRNIHLATDSEKQQLLSALEKEGKDWDSEHKMIVDFKPKCEFKPFDKVLGRNEKGDVWEAELFSQYREKSQYPFCCIGFNRKYCIPYNEETAHLLGTADDWEGGEG